jgi:hypothetical protein
MTEQEWSALKPGNIIVKKTGGKRYVVRQFIKEVRLLSVTEIFPERGRPSIISVMYDTWDDYTRIA